MKNIKNKYQKTYTDEYRKSLVKRMLPPENITDKELSEETGVSRNSLRTWLEKYRQEVSKKNQQWIQVEVDEEDDKENNNTSVMIKIGSIGIEVKTGFDKNLLEEVIMVVNRI